MQNLVVKGFNSKEAIEEFLEKSEKFKRYLDNYVVYDTETYAVRGRCVDELIDRIQEARAQGIISFDVNVNREAMEKRLGHVFEKGHNVIIHLLRLGYAAHVKGGEIVDEVYFRDPGSFATFLSKVVKRGSRYLGLIAHNHGFDLRTTGIDIEMEKRGWDIRYFSVDVRSFMGLMKNERKIYLWDTLNVFPESLESLSKYTKTKKVEIDDFNAASLELLRQRVKNDVMINYELVELFKKVTKELNVDPLPTLSQMSMLYLLKNYRGNIVFTKDQVKRFLVLAEQAYRGGRTEIFFRGKIRGRIYGLDINSLYPYVMAEYKYPVGLIEERSNITAGELMYEISQGNLVLADVSTELDGNIGISYKDRLVFPKVRDARVVLNTAELAYLAKRGLIKEVHRAFIFKGDYIFNTKELYERRKEYKKQGRDDLQYMVKILMNSGYGRYGYLRQFTYSGKELGGVDRLIYEGLNVNIKNMLTNNIVIISNLLYSEAMPLIAAEVTANARMHITKYKILVEENGGRVYYMDTDSLYVDEKGYEILKNAGVLNDSELGMFKLEKVIDEMEIEAPKVYRFKDEKGKEVVKKKGVSKSALEVEENVYLQEQSTGVYVNRELINYGVVWYEQEKELKNEYVKGIVMSDGGVRPLELETYNVNDWKKYNLVDENVVKFVTRVLGGEYEDM